VISVVVCTRDRPDDVERAVNAVLGSDGPAFELVVVDQSRDAGTRRRVERLADADSRVRVIRDAGTGASRARNLGIEATRGEVIVFTDDDCEPEPGWLSAIIAPFDEDTAAGIAFGTVVPAPFDPTAGFIVGFTPRRRRRMTGRLGKCLDSGIGANMAFRREAAVRAGGFDELLGPGTGFPSCEEGDLAYRILREGYALWHVPGASVIHHGFRDWQAGGSLMRRTYLGIAAAYMKHLRRGDAVAVLLLLQQTWYCGENLASSLFNRRKPLGFGRVAGLISGCRRSFDLRVEPSSRLYRLR
jgi:GT2 family glycosyltransferase